MSFPGWLAASGGPDPSAEVAEWVRRRSSRLDDWCPDALLAAKNAGPGGTVSVVLPARNEQDTVGEIVAAIRAELVVGVALVDEIVVVDSGSADRTAEIARAAGARVVSREEILPRVPVEAGKGEVLWRSLLATSGDIVCFVDADLRRFDPAMVRGILGPLLTDPAVQLVKAAYDRPFGGAGSEVAGDAAAEVGLPVNGGRVTELVARPLLNLHWPQLAGVVQPLAGEYAARRELLAGLTFPCGYGVEFSLLIDTLRIAGLDAVAQVDVGSRHHRHQDDQALGRMAGEIWQTALMRMGSAQRAAPYRMTQFQREDGVLRPSTHDITTVERPPMRTIPEYRQRFSVG
ncbi:MAG TPA: glucosyl-3-phosphoglycerate synthase [Actinocrinis sp.]|nr:glucosyl-3-phosphoglycerate synthase [Actinocrinis sp.]